MLGSDDFVLCASNLLHASLIDKLEAASAGGFRGISLWPSDYHGARSEGYSDTDLRALFADHCVEIAELDTLVTWLPGSTPAALLSQRDRQNFAATADDFFALAEALGARSINLAQGAGPPHSFDAIVESFAGMCDRAGEHGLRALLEFMPFSDVPDLATASRVVELAGRPNAGVMFDSWHHFRGDGSEQEIREVPGTTIQGLQIGDAPREPEPDLIIAAMGHRLVPGAGDAPLADWLRALRDGGCEAPIGVEVFSGELAAKPAVEVGKLLGRAIRDLLAQALGGSNPTPGDV